MRTEFLLIALFAFLISACVPRINSAGAGMAAPKLTSDTFITTDGNRLPLKHWLPSSSPSAVVLALHGFNDYSNFIHGTGVFLTERNIAVYSYDQRGFGAAPSRGRWPGMDVLKDDCKTMTRLLHEKHPDIPLFLLGESMGGAVVMTAMTDNDPPDFDGVILAAPAVWSRKTMPLPQRVLLWVAARLVAWMEVTGESLDIAPSDNREMLLALGRDPLVIKKTRIEAIHGLANLMDAAYEAAPRYSFRSLVLYGERDEIIPQKPVFHVAKKLPGINTGQQRFILYEKGYHMLLRDLQGDMVRQDIYEWLQDAESELPSIAASVAHEMRLNTEGKLEAREMRPSLITGKEGK